VILTSTGELLGKFVGFDLCHALLSEDFVYERFDVLVVHVEFIFLILFGIVNLLGQ
jgi:hypothetical protein